MKRGSEKTRLVSFQIDAGEWEKFMKASTEEGLSASSNLRLLVKKYLRRRRRRDDEKRDK